MVYDFAVNSAQQIKAGQAYLICWTGDLNITITGVAIAMKGPMSEARFVCHFGGEQYIASFEELTEDPETLIIDCTSRVMIQSELGQQAAA